MEKVLHDKVIHLINVQELKILEDFSRSDFIKLPKESRMNLNIIEQ